MVHDLASDGQLRASPVAFMSQAQDDSCNHLQCHPELLCCNCCSSKQSWRADCGAGSLDGFALSHSRWRPDLDAFPCRDCCSWKQLQVGLAEFEACNCLSPLAALLTTSAAICCSCSKPCSAMASTPQMPALSATCPMQWMLSWRACCGAPSPLRSSVQTWRGECARLHSHGCGDCLWCVTAMHL